MKECKHRTDTFESALERLEHIVESIDPNATVHIKDLIGRLNLADQNSEITQATIMLLKKYGITYQE